MLFIFLSLASKVIKNNARIMKKMFIVVSRSLMGETVRGCAIYFPISNEFLNGNNIFSNTQ